MLITEIQETEIFSTCTHVRFIEVLEVRILRTVNFFL